MGESRVRRHQSAGPTPPRTRPLRIDAPLSLLGHLDLEQLAALVIDLNVVCSSSNDRAASPRAPSAPRGSRFRRRRARGQTGPKARGDLPHMQVVDLADIWHGSHGPADLIRIEIKTGETADDRRRTADRPTGSVTPLAWRCGGRRTPERRSDHSEDQKRNQQHGAEGDRDDRHRLQLPPLAARTVVASILCCRRCQCWRVMCCHSPPIIQLQSPESIAPQPPVPKEPPIIPAPTISS